MMPYSVEIVFTGLCFFCFAGTDPACQDFTYVYLVNATEKETVCKKELPGGHEPVLTFDRRFLQYADASHYELKPSPEGGQLVVAPLSDPEHRISLDLCFREECADPSGCEPRWPVPLKTADSLLGRSKDQAAPAGWKPDANHIGWIASIPHVEKRCQDYPLRRKVGGLDYDYVTGRLRLDWGTLSTRDHARKPRNGLTRPYIVWDSRYGDDTEMPKAFAGAVTLTLPRVQGALLIQTDCSTTPRTLFRLRGAPLSTLRLHVSNLPTHEVDPVGQAEQDHFRWYYRLYDWYCPEKVGIPHVARSEDLPAVWQTSKKLGGVINPDVICPPGGTTP